MVSSGFKFVLLLFLCTSMGLMAQSDATDRGDNLYACSQFDKAAAHYIQQIKSDNHDASTLGKLADCYRRTGQYDLASIYYRKALRVDRKNSKFLFEYAQVAMTQGDYKLALQTFEDYQKKEPNDQRCQAFIDWCKNIDMHLETDYAFRVSKLNFNSRHDDLSPVIHEGGIVYLSDQPSRHADGVSEIGMKQAFFTEQTSNSNWSGPDVFAGQDARHDMSGPVSFSADGNIFYFTQLEETPVGSTRMYVEKAYQSELQNGKWSAPTEVSFNSRNNRYNVTQIVANANNTIAYFSSDMAGGFGGMDLYMVRKSENGHWSPPTNLGPAVNTAGDELYPKVHSDETLYFSSDGHGGIGGLDIYSSSLKADGRWTTPYNMGVPINSAVDDHSLCLEFDKELGYFSSNRRGGVGGFDIYQVDVSSGKAREMLDLANIKLENIANKEEIVKEEMPAMDGLVPVSNRISEELKENKVKYMEFDLTYLNKKSSEELTFYIIGRLVDADTEENLTNESVVLRDLKNGTESIYKTQSDGNFFFELTPNREYVVFVKQGKHVSDYQGISTFNRDKSQILHVVLLAYEDEEKLLKKDKEFRSMFGVDVRPTQIVKEGGDSKVRDSFSVPEKNPLANPINGTKEKVTTPKKTNNTEWEPRTDSRGSSSSSKSPEEVRKGVVIKIEVGSFFDQVDKDRRFIRKLNGNYEVEDENGIFRYLSGKYDNVEDATIYMNYLRSIGYKSAYLVVYKNGLRMNMNYQEALRRIDEQVK